MFFTPELLSKRDSGFGLLWLAATLGSRSAFKKLPKRSVLTADIKQLCDLISEPDEPLALRLSSNLMFGVVRVYKVKQEIFLNDVTNCVATLKKVVQDLRNSAAVDGQLQMPNPTVRASALTIVPDPKEAYTLDYDAFVADWDEYLNIGADTTKGSEDPFENEDADFDPSNKIKRSKANVKATPLIEVLRKEAHTLDEHHEHLLSASFDLSFSQDPAHAPGASSSQADLAFEHFFPFSDGLDVGDGFGDDLAKELGWAVSPVKTVDNIGNVDVDHPGLQFENEEGFNMDMNFELNIEDMPMMVDLPPANEQTAATPVRKPVARRLKTPRKENAAPISRLGSVFSKGQPSPTTSFSRLLLSQGDQPIQPLKDITGEVLNRPNQAVPRKNVKRTRLLLDARTELTDDELKIARAKYVECQKRLRREMMNKRLEKDNERYIEELIWGVPRGIQEEGLINFWRENFKVQVEARSGILRIHQEDDGPPVKKRKTAPTHRQREENDDENAYNNGPVYQDAEWGLEWGAENMDTAMDMAMTIEDAGNRHSSEEPGQARRVSRAASAIGVNNLGFDIGPRNSGSQRSSLFPWDNAGAGPSSSTGNAPYGLPDVDQAIEYVDVRLRSSSLSRRNSPLAPSQRGSIQAAGVTFSPARGGSQIFGEDFAFEVDEPAVPEDTQQETQKSDLNLITLERNSYNFLEYARMQNQTLSQADGRLTFETVVPKMSSTRHVAAAAFYHCLVLATKNLLHLEQPDAYGSVVINII